MQIKVKQERAGRVALEPTYRRQERTHSEELSFDLHTRMPAHIHTSHSNEKQIHEQCFSRPELGSLVPTSTLSMAASALEGGVRLGELSG